MTRPKLTYLINKVNYGGAEIGMVRLLSGLNPEEFDVTAVTLKEAHPDIIDELPDSVSVHDLNLHESLSVTKLRTLYRQISDTDILVCSLYPAILIGPVIATLSRVPHVYVWRHNTRGISWLRKQLNLVAFRLADGVLADSEATAELVAKWGVDRSRISVLPLSGIDVDRFPTANHRDSAEPIRIGTVGRLVEQKGYPELIECAKRLPAYEFHVVGDGPLAAEFDRAPKNVIVHGRVEQAELDRLWESFDIYFQPSRYEGLCITAIEAMAAELPVVASAVNGLTESIVHEETGYLVAQGDIDGYCEALEQLASNPDQRSQFGAAGKRRVRDQYSMNALATKFRNTIS